MAYLSHTGHAVAAPRRKRVSLNWRLTLVLALNAVFWVSFVKLVLQAL